MTNSNTAIVNAAATDAAGEDNFVTAEALTGPYIPTEYIRKERLSSMANDDYWGGVPLLAGIEYIAIPDTTAGNWPCKPATLTLPSTYLRKGWNTSIPSPVCTAGRPERAPRW